MTHDGKTFTGQVIRLDGNTYTRCTFVDCQILYGGGIANTTHCVFTGTTQLRFDKAAALTVDFMRSMYPLGQHVIEGIFAEIRKGPGGAKTSWN